MIRIPRLRPGHGRWPIVVVVTVLAAGLVLSAPVTQAVAASSATISVDGSSGGLVFDGDGAISGGGGNTRLLLRRRGQHIKGLAEGHTSQS